jgi:hypothetical protein
MSTMRAIDTAIPSPRNVPLDSTPRAHRARTWSPIAAGTLAFVWLLVLSSWLGLTTGAVLTVRDDTLFDSDIAGSVIRLTDHNQPRVTRNRYYTHSFETIVWRPLCKLLERALATAMAPDRVRLLAPRLLVATVAAIGIGSLMSVGLAYKVPLLTCWLLLIPYLLFSVNVIVAVPDHFGLSNGLLSAGFATWAVARQSWQKVMTLATLAIATAGTTISNGLFMAICLAHQRLPSIRLAAMVGVGAMIAFAAVTLVLAEMSTSMKWYVRSFTNERLVRNPAAAGLYALMTVVYPAIAPSPHLKTVWDHQRLMVTYEPFDVRHYSWLQASGILAWVALLMLATVGTFRNPRSRPYGSALVIWLLFNALLHNLWGDEYFLYSTHWSWALMGLLMLGLSETRTTWVALAVMVLVPAQVLTLIAIRAALQSIPF